METAHRAAVLGDDPAEAGFDGGGGVVQVVAVQTHTGLETEGVTGAQTGGLETLRARDLEESLDDGGGDLGHGTLVGSEGQLKTVLAGVATAGDEDGGGDAAVSELEVGHDGAAEVELVGACDIAGQELVEDLGALRALEGDQTTTIVASPLDIATKLAELLIQVLGVLLKARAVGDDVELILSQPRDNRVIHNTTGSRPQERRQLALHERLALPVRRGDLLQERRRRRTLEGVLHHVAHVEQRGMVSGKVVRLSEGEVGVLHGEIVIRKGHQFASVGEMEVIQRRLLEVGGRTAGSITHALLLEPEASCGGEGCRSSGRGQAGSRPRGHADSLHDDSIEAVG